eukprot:jgi/Chlat1/3815/Chrsp26S04050
MASSQPEKMANTDEVAGAPQSFTTTVTERAAAISSSFKPINRIDLHLCSYPFHADDMTRQIEVHHYCTQLTEDFWQCAFYDSDKKNSRLIGVEYIVSSKVFKDLPEEEKPLWHTHAYEVKGGTMFMPSSAPEALVKPAEDEVMRRMVDTYGKVWLTWQFDRGDKIPLGVPSRMMSITGPGQLSPELEKRMQREYGVCSMGLTEARKHIEAPVALHPAADAWQKGKSFKLEPVEVDFKAE